MLDLVSAALLPNAVQYDLRLSVLLKGARGVGKQAAVRWVAQKAGIHLVEVCSRMWLPESCTIDSLGLNRLTIPLTLGELLRCRRRI